MTVAARMREFLRSRGIPFDLLPHPRSHSARETATAAHVAEDHIAKGVLLRDAENLLLVLVPGDQWVRVKALSDELSRELRMASEDEIARCFDDCQRGSVPPFGMVYGVETLVDQTLDSLANVYFEVGDHERIAHVTGDGFRELTRGLRRGHFAHDD